MKGKKIGKPLTLDYRNENARREKGGESEGERDADTGGWEN